MPPSQDSTARIPQQWFHAATLLGASTSQKTQFLGLKNKKVKFPAPKRPLRARRPEQRAWKVQKVKFPALDSLKWKSGCSWKSGISIGKNKSNQCFWWKLDKEIITIGSFLAYRFGLRICMGGDFFENVRKGEEKYVEKYSFGAELGLGGSVWGIRGWKMIARVLGRPWKPSRGPKRP